MRAIVALVVYCDVGVDFTLRASISIIAVFAVENQLFAESANSLVIGEVSVDLIAFGTDVIALALQAMIEIATGNANALLLIEVIPFIASIANIFTLAFQASKTVRTWNTQSTFGTFEVISFFTESAFVFVGAFKTCIAK